ncbi:MAG: urease accessory protein UreE [Granulosicoccus sp.]
MLSCTQIKRRADFGLDETDSQVVGTITLDETDRHRRRYAMTSDNGIAFLLELKTATLLREGDLLLLDDGRRIEVRAEAEPLYEIRANDKRHLLQLSWHLGNRHLPTQIMADHLRIRRDSVIRDMIIGLGGQVSDTLAGFDPEGGAYADSHDHDHDYGVTQQTINV